MFIYVHFSSRNRIAYSEYEFPSNMGRQIRSARETSYFISRIATLCVF